ncbi:MAG: Hypothetical protein BHV28_12410 [Candidatus Tokpelaia hoelldobleri]|uniref:TIGR02301 family protein n=1 Tax=Candidatus Tokpelaia hoelldobleri TaxID=1902579 RepID=A0A1U9JVQ2_9HYPH|nr:MAG: Hypothetical protein BHV28_12410 [Candidatus Tokpelaia hoelldoblerii]
MKIRICTLAAFLFVFSSASLMAQQPAGLLQYDTKLLRLSEILGSLHYLRNLCGEEGTQWRDEMNALLTAEQPNAARKARLLGAFNDAYRVFSDRYSQCTPAAHEAVNRYTKEGISLSQELVDRFGN